MGNDELFRHQSVFMREERAITAASVSALAYPQVANPPRGLSLHPAAPAAPVALSAAAAAQAAIGGAVVGGPARFVRADVHTEPLAPVFRCGLTPRDVVVLGFLAQGWTTASIAHELAYAESTIKKEVHIIVHRLGARNRTHAVAMAIRDALI